MSARRILARAVVAAIVVAAAGIALSAWTVHTAGQAHARRRAARQHWEVLDEDLPDDLSDVERAMLDRGGAA